MKRVRLINIYIISTVWVTVGEENRNKKFTFELSEAAPRTTKAVVAPYTSAVTGPHYYWGPEHWTSEDILSSDTTNNYGIYSLPHQQDVNNWLDAYQNELSKRPEHHLDFAPMQAEGVCILICNFYIS